MPCSGSTSSSALGRTCQAPHGPCSGSSSWCDRSSGGVGGQQSCLRVRASETVCLRKGGDPSATTRPTPALCDSRALSASCAGGSIQGLAAHDVPEASVRLQGKERSASTILWVRADRLIGIGSPVCWVEKGVSIRKGLKGRPRRWLVAQNCTTNEEEGEINGGSRRAGGKPQDATSSYLWCIVLLR